MAAAAPTPAAGVLGQRLAAYKSIHDRFAGIARTGRFPNEIGDIVFDNLPWVDSIFMLRAHTTLLTPPRTATYDNFLRRHARTIFGKESLYSVIFTHKAFNGDKKHAVSRDQPTGRLMTWQDRLDVLVHTKEWQRGTDMPDAHARGRWPGVDLTRTYLQQIKRVKQSNLEASKKERRVALLHGYRKDDETARLQTASEQKKLKDRAAALVECLCDTIEKQKMRGYDHWTCYFCFRYCYLGDLQQTWDGMRRLCKRCRDKEAALHLISFDRLHNIFIQTDSFNGRVSFANFIRVFEADTSNGIQMQYLLRADADYLAKLIFNAPSFDHAEHRILHPPAGRNNFFVQRRSQVYFSRVFPAVEEIREVLAGGRAPLHPTRLSQEFLAGLNKQIELPSTKEWLMETTKWIWERYRVWNELPNPRLKNRVVFAREIAFVYLDNYLEHFDDRISHEKLLRNHATVRVPELHAYIYDQPAIGLDVISCTKQSAELHSRLVHTGPFVSNDPQVNLSYHISRTKVLMTATESFVNREVLQLFWDTLVAISLPYEQALQLATPAARFEHALKILFWHDCLLGQAIIQAPPGQPFISIDQVPRRAAERFVNIFWTGLEAASHPVCSALIQWAAGKSIYFDIRDRIPRTPDCMPAVFQYVQEMPLDLQDPNICRIGRLLWCSTASMVPAPMIPQDGGRTLPQYGAQPLSL